MSSSSSSANTFSDLKATYLSEFDFKGVQVSAFPLFPSVLRGLQTELPVLVEIKIGQRSDSGKDEDQDSAAFNVCLVLDNSGSMAGARLDRCKQAIQTIIKQLSKRDTLSLIIYSSDARTIFVDCNHSHKNHMLSSVKAIRADGMTNLHEGLKVGVESLKRSIEKQTSVSGSIKKVNRVFLFSDGFVNQGVTAASTIMASVKSWLAGTDISISTFGIGEDYDEKLMTAIAQHGNGDSFFIETEADIEDMVSKGLRGVSNMVAESAVLNLRGLGDAVIKNIPGYDMTETPGKIIIRNLRINGLIQLIVNLDIRVPGQNEFSENDMLEEVESRQILGYSLTFEGEHSVNLEDCKDLRGSVSVKYTSDSSELSEDKKHQDVVSYLAIKEAAKIDEEVVEHLANNRTAAALVSKKRAVAAYSAVASKDRRGFAQMMRNKGERMVNVLETDGNTRFAQKLQYQQQQSAARPDMGYGLYE